MLAEHRWGSKEEQVCPECGVMRRHYVIHTRRQWRCKDCKHTFSVTSRTSFNRRRISHKKLLSSLFLFVTSHKGKPALELKRILGGDYRTWFSLQHKIRDAFSRTVPIQKLGGVVEIDGGYFSGVIRNTRKKRCKKKPYHNRRATIVMREKNGRNKEGAGRTVAFICRSENPSDIAALVKMWIEPGTTIRTDDHPAYRGIPPLLYKHEVVNHSIEYSSETGVNENQCESFFSRMRRAQKGIFHRITPHYMIDYANEIAWREEVRRMDTATQLQKLVSRVFNAGRSPDWSRYSHGNHRQVEPLFAA